MGIPRKRTLYERLPFIVTVIFILIAPIEIIYRTEQYIYPVCAAILGYLVYKRGYLKLNSSKYWIFFMWYAFLACTWSKSVNVYSSLLAMYAQLIFLVLQLQFSYSKEDYQKIKAAFLLQNWIFIAVCFQYGKYAGSRLFLDSGLSGADPNYLSGWFIIPLCFAVEYLFSSSTKIWQMMLLIAQIALSFYFIMQSASQSGLITNTLAVILSACYTLKRDYQKHTLRAIVLVAVFAAGVIIAVNYMPSYLLYRLNKRDMTFTGRTKWWTEATILLLTNPLGLIFGFGTSSVRLYISSGLVTHNTFLDIFFNQGAIGEFLLLSFMISNLKKIKRSRIYVTAAALSMSVLVFTLSALYTRFLMLMFFLIGADLYDS